MKEKQSGQRKSKRRGSKRKTEGRDRSERDREREKETERERERERETDRQTERQSERGRQPDFFGLPAVNKSATGIVLVASLNFSQTHLQFLCFLLESGLFYTAATFIMNFLKLLKTFQQLFK
jgi:hypothetical protein